MGKFATRKVLRELCSRNGLTLYRHRLDGASYQMCAGGYVVNGYTTRHPAMDVLYEMQKKMIHLLKYGDKNDSGHDDDISWHKEKHVIEPLSKPLTGYCCGKVYTLRSPEDDADLQEYFDLQGLYKTNIEKFTE